MMKKWFWILAGIILAVYLTGCADQEAQTPAETKEQPIQTEAQITAVDLLAAHRKAAKADETAVLVMEQDQISVTDLAGLSDMLGYDQWREAEAKDAAAVIRVQIGGDELSFFEGELVRLGSGSDEAWFSLPGEVLVNLVELWQLETMPTDEDFVYDNAWMWNKYMYETITSLGNAKHFDQNDVTEIDELVEYVWYRYCSDFESAEAMGFELSPDITAYYLFPRELAYKEAEKYFAFDMANANLDDSNMYLEEYDAFQMHYVGPREEWEVSGNNPWSIYYEGVESLGNGRYEARMVSYEDKEAGIISRESVYTLQLSEAGTFLFESGERRMPFYPLSDFSDSIMPLDEWKDQIEEYALLIGESRAELFFLEADEQIKIHRVSKANYQLLDSLTLLFEPEEHLVQIHETEKGGTFLVCTSHYVRVFSENWEQIETIVLPEFFTEKVLSETTWDDFTLETIFTSYDVTDDLRQIVYGDEEGLKWFELGTEKPEVKLLAKSEEYPQDDLAPLSVYLSPRWVDGDQKIFMMRSGYEGNRGIALYDVQAGVINRYDHGWTVCSNQIQPAKGVVMPNEFDYNRDTGEGRTLHYYLDFSTGERNEFVFDRMGGEDMPDGSETYFGESTLALLVRDYSEDKVKTYVQRIDPENWEMIDETAVKAAKVRILGADRAGNVFVYYFYNQESRGFGVLPSRDS